MKLYKRPLIEDATNGLGWLQSWVNSIGSALNVAFDWKRDSQSMATDGIWVWKTVNPNTMGVTVYIS